MGGSNAFAATVMDTPETLTSVLRKKTIRGSGEQWNSEPA